jgi:hypothetical protein
MTRRNEHPLQNRHSLARRPDVMMPSRGVLLESLDRSRQIRADTLRTVAEIHERERIALEGAREIVESRLGAFEDTPIGGGR